MGHSQRVLVTGAAGMIGANLTHRLVADGYQVSVFLRPRTNRLRLELVERALDIHEADMTDASAVEAAVTAVKPDIVFHLASTIWGKQPAASSAAHVEVNILGTVHLLEALRTIPGTRLVFTSSSAVYGAGLQLREYQFLSPGTVYGASKAATTILLQTYARLYQLSTVTLHLFMPYGPWEHPNRLIPHTILSALEGRDVLMTLGHQQRDLIYIDDVVEALLLAATKPLAPGAVFNIGSGVGVPVREVVERLLRLLGDPVKPVFGAMPMRPDEIMEMSADITAAKMYLEWEPRTSLEDGLRRTIAWFREHRELATQLAQRPSESARDAVGASR